MIAGSAPAASSASHGLHLAALRREVQRRHALAVLGAAEGGLAAGIGAELDQARRIVATCPQAAAQISAVPR